jgi:hypothetical protein
MGAGEETATVVPLRVKAAIPAPDISSGTEWAHAQAVLHGEDPATFAAWVAALVRVERAGGRITLRAPSRFHASYVQTHLERRLIVALQDVDDTVSEVRITTG